MSWHKKNKSDSSKKGKKKDKKGILNAIGVETEHVPDSDTQRNTEIETKLIQAWVYLRDRIDNAVFLFYANGGSFEEMQKYVERPAIDSIKAYLEELRSKRVYLSQGDPSQGMARKDLTKPMLKIVPGSVKWEDNRPKEFTIEERFNDYALQQHAVSENQSDWVKLGQCHGEDRVIRATVMIVGGVDFKLLKVTAGE